MNEYFNTLEKFVAHKMSVWREKLYSTQGSLSYDIKHKMTCFEQDFWDTLYGCTCPMEENELLLTLSLPRTMRINEIGIFTFLFWHLLSRDKISYTVEVHGNGKKDVKLKVLWRYALKLWKGVQKAWKAGYN